MSQREALHTASAAASPSLGAHAPHGAGFSPGLPLSPAERHRNELHTLNVAIVVNIAIFIAKLWVHMVTGSSAMLAEALHSMADVLNQGLLRVGLMKSREGPTEMHPYGFVRDRFIWSLISAVGIFFLGAGASVIHGLHTLMEHQLHLEGMMWNYLVLGVSGLLEGYSLWVATRYVIAGAQAQRLSVLQYIRSGMDPTTVAVMLEDGGAVLGLMIAGVCTALAHATGNAMFDAAGSILVGLLLGAIATFLVQKNRQLLIGRSMAPRDVQAVQEYLARDPVVAYVIDTRTEEIGPSVYRFTAGVAWDGDKLVERYLDRCGRDRLVAQLRTAVQRNDPQLLDELIKGYGRDIISAVGAEVDRIEADIQRINPGIRYVDLETDRGRSESGRRGSGSSGLGGALASTDDCYTCSLNDEARPAGSSRGSRGSSSSISSYDLELDLDRIERWRQEQRLLHKEDTFPSTSASGSGGGGGSGNGGALGVVAGSSGRLKVTQLDSQAPAEGGAKLAAGVAAAPAAASGQQQQQQQATSASVAPDGTRSSAG